MKWFLALIILALSAGALELDSLLSIHSLYATDSISIAFGDSTPKAGIMGTNGTLFDSSSNSRDVDNYLFVEVRATRIIGGDHGFILNDNNVYYNNTDQVWGDRNDGLFRFDGTGDTVYQDQVYPILPVFPDLSGIDYLDTGSMILNNGESNYTTFLPGHYSEITLADDAVGFILAGQYNITKLTLGYNAELIVLPYYGNYSTELFVRDEIILREGSKFMPNNAAGHGKISVFYSGTKDIWVGKTPSDPWNISQSQSEFSGTIVAEHSIVHLRSSPDFHGAIYCKILDLFGVNIYDNFIYSKVDVNYSPVVISDTTECLENSFITWTPTVVNPD